MTVEADSTDPPDPHAAAEQADPSVGNRRVGLLKDKFRAPIDFDADNEEIARGFFGEEVASG